MESKYLRYVEFLEDLKKEDRFRIIPPDTDDTPLIDLCNNDYMGLANSWKSFYKEKDFQYAFSSSASRLLASRQAGHSSLEALLSELYGRSILIFNSGYHANVGLIQALNVRGTIFLVDKLIHASVIDGLSMANAEFYRWKHNDLSHLEKILEKHYDSAERIVVVLESIYSMDGDIPDLQRIVDLKHRFPSMMIYLDEAHAFGVRGKHGLGIAEETGTLEDIDILVGTFGKACASTGAFVAAAPFMVEYFINACRSFIFSTALPPINMRWTEKMVRELIKMDQERQYLLSISKDFGIFISEITGQKNPSSSHIVPLPVGDAAKALHLAATLREKGIRALAIRRPTVPPGGERIRFSLNASLSLHEIDTIKKVIREVLNEN